MSNDASPYCLYPAGTPFALPDGMQHSADQEQNNVTARVRALEAHLYNMDRRMHESHESWSLGVTKITEGVRDTHDLLYNPQHGAFVRLDRLEQLMFAQSKFKAWLVGFVSSGALLIAGAVLGKLFGTK